MIPNYYRINLSNKIPSLSFLQKPVDIILVIPADCTQPKAGQIFRSIFELKSRYNSGRSFLIFCASDTPPASKVSPMAALWDYFLSQSDIRDQHDMFFVEICFSKPAPLYGSLLQIIFKIMKPIPFLYSMVINPSETDFSFPSAFKLNLLLESGILNKTDLNIAAYTIPFYKGFMTNFWMMPLSYLFGRQLRNPASPDFAFSAGCLNYWLKLKWKDFAFMSSCHLFLTFSVFSSGLRIHEFFLGDHDGIGFFSGKEIPELIRTGLQLLSAYKNFIRKGTSLIPGHNPIPSSIPFHIYSPSDLDETLRTYHHCQCEKEREAVSLLKYHSHFQARIRESLLSLFSKGHHQKNEETPTEPWPALLHSILQSYLQMKSSRHQLEKEKILNCLFYAKARNWAAEIRQLIQVTKHKALQDESRGCRWAGGESGQYWHIHDQHEKKLHEDALRFYHLKHHLFPG
ncbi:MAG: hypothetical protein JW774_03325 [Candidatus Aureabacteria bacterium]|nr:hypothetical protein [Candidatus Auribacterota bacterium]